MDMNALGKIGMIMQATGMGLKGQDGFSVYRNYEQEQEKAKRKEAIEGLIGSMGLSQQKADFLSMLPFEQASPIIWDLMNPRPVGGGGGAAAAKAQADIDAWNQLQTALAGGGAQPAAAGGGYSMGVPDDLGSPVAAAGGLSLGVPAMESPAPATTPGLSFGNIQPSAPKTPEQASLYENARNRLNTLYSMPPPAPGTSAAKSYKAMIDHYEGMVKAFAPPEMEQSPIAALEARALAAGLTPDTAEYRNFMLTNGRNDGLVIESDGQGGFRMAQGAAAGTQKPFNETQSKDNVFVTRATGALQVLEPIAESLVSRAGRAAEMDPTGLARELQTPEFQVAKQAGDEFLQAILRKDTGAAITEPEQYLYGRTYLPQPGDGPAVLQAKSEARKRAVAAIQSGMSPAQMIAVEKALGQVSVPEKEPEQKKSDGPDFSGMTMDDLLKNVPTTEEAAAAWNKRWEALQ